jgi:hypothetical protein
MSRTGLAVVLLVLGLVPSQAKVRTLTFRSAELTPSQGFQGVPGAKKFIYSFTASQKPTKGGCTSAGTALVKFTDGANSNVSLATAGFTRVDAESFEIICATTAGKLDKTKTSIAEVWTRSDGAAYIATISLLQTQVGLQLPPDTVYLSGATTGKWKVKHKP